VPGVDTCFPLITLWIDADSRQYKNVTAEIRGRWLQDVVSLPPIADLRRFLDQPFDERAKIPVDRYRFEAFVSNPLEMVDNVEPEHVQMLFRIDDHERAESLYGLLYAAIMTNPPNHEATESAFHLFWDLNIRRILEALIPGGISIRDSNHHTSTDGMRPDFGFLYLSLCPFRGEEKSPTNAEDPRAELSNKMDWTYDPAPYVLGKPFGYTLVISHSSLSDRILRARNYGSPDCYLSPRAWIQSTTDC
jgi:hypothetical protein